jgi:hypothetical protein
MRMRLAVLIILCIPAVIQAGPNLVTDPGFESCLNLFDSPPPGWTASSANVFCTVNPHTGSWSGELAGSGGTLSQIISTTNGHNYDFSFWLKDAATGTNSFTASFGANQVLHLVNPGNFSYTLEDFTVAATGPNTTISFAAVQFGGAVDLDDVSVTDLGASVPEPSSLALLGSGLLVLCLFRRRRY